jgi:hypothetical protein
MLVIRFFDNVSSIREMPLHIKIKFSTSFKDALDV